MSEDASEGFRQAPGSEKWLGSEKPPGCCIPRAEQGTQESTHEAAEPPGMCRELGWQVGKGVGGGVHWDTFWGELSVTFVNSRPLEARVLRRHCHE